MSVTKPLSKKAALKLEMDKSLKICHEYTPIKVLDVKDRVEAMFFLWEWADCVQEGLSKHLYSPHMMTSWLACMSSYLHVMAHFVDRTERIVMIDGCLPCLLEVLEYYTPHPVLETCHQVCRDVVCILRTMADVRQERLYTKHDWDMYSDLYQPCTEETRKYAEEVIGAYLTRLTADGKYLSLSASYFPPDMDYSEYYDSYPHKVRDVKNLCQWVEAGMFLTGITCPACRKEEVCVC